MLHVPQDIDDCCFMTRLVMQALFAYPVDILSGDLYRDKLVTNSINLSLPSLLVAFADFHGSSLYIRKVLLDVVIPHQLNVLRVIPVDPTT